MRMNDRICTAISRGTSCFGNRCSVGTSLRLNCPHPMSKEDYRQRFKSCGKDVVIEDNIFIEHPEVMEVGDRVKFMRGFYMGMGKPALCRIGSDVTFYPNCFIQGSAARFIIEDHVDFFPGTYISLGAQNSFIE